MSFTQKIEMTYPHRRNNPDVTLSTNVNVADDIFYDSTLFARSQNDENRDDARREKFNARHPPNTEGHFNKTFPRGARRCFASASFCSVCSITIRQKINSNRLIYVDGRISVRDSKNRAIMAAEDNQRFPAQSIGTRWLYGRDIPEFIDFSKLESQSELKFHCDFLVFDGSMNHCVASPCSTRCNTNASVLLKRVLELTSRACTGTRTRLTWTLVRTRLMPSPPTPVSSADV
ncbi:hypothetical protein JTE90_006303 [Oedothorax gibbosus]|uniref:Uncharacterized protein n=1 Tax=Oedothorax gibbosus TaxID=931172 RepID=A0AAV6U3J6_9ARAC|nr:hypothetical protein JTE90_006303 [Oedothorax gibbosus]